VPRTANKRLRLRRAGGKALRMKKGKAKATGKTRRVRRKSRAARRAAAARRLRAAGVKVRSISYGKTFKRHVKRLKRRDRRAVKTIWKTKRVRSSRSAQRLLIEYAKLRSVKKGRGLPIGLRDLKQMTASKAWSQRRMTNLAKVIRLANHYARKDKTLTAKQAFDKALRAVGIYKKYYSGVCGA
jgi:hypothetical protein